MSLARLLRAGRACAGCLLIVDDAVAVVVQSGRTVSGRWTDGARATAPKAGAIVAGGGARLRAGLADPLAVDAAGMAAASLLSGGGANAHPVEHAVGAPIAVGVFFFTAVAIFFVDGAHARP